MKGERNLSNLSGLQVYLPNGRRLGVVHDAVVEHASLSCTHLFVTETPDDLVEDSIHIAVPWRWVRFTRRNMEWLMIDFCYVAYVFHR